MSGVEEFYLFSQGDKLHVLYEQLTMEGNIYLMERLI